ncbi:MAG: hypothetical protein U0736_18965 [Gemmataceae bacterium]
MDEPTRQCPAPRNGSPSRWISSTSSRSRWSVPATVNTAMSTVTAGRG